MAEKVKGFTPVPTGQTGRQVCTIADYTKINKDMKLGPDGDNWELLTHDEVMTLAADRKSTFRHNAVKKIIHICAGQGTWAFAIPNSPELLPQAVCFLHMGQPSKLAKIAGEGKPTGSASAAAVASASASASSALGGTIVFGGFEFLTGYDQARITWGSYVWRRKLGVNSAELAVNFCIPAALK